MSELLEPKLDLLIEKIENELSVIGEQLTIANQLKKIELAEKLKYNTINDTDTEICKALALVEKLQGYDGLDYNLREELQRRVNNYEENHLNKRFSE